MKRHKYIILLLTSLFISGCTSLNDKLGERNLTSLKKSCAKNDGKSCASLGALYMDGSYISRDMLKASTYAKKACDLNSAYGCDVLSITIEMQAGSDYDYFKKYGVKKKTNIPKSVLVEITRIVKKACKLGSVRSCNSLGINKNQSKKRNTSSDNSFSKRLERARAQGAIQGKTEWVSDSTIGKFSSGNVDTLKKNIRLAEKYIEVKCKNMANEMKSEYPQLRNIHNKSLSYCIKTATNDLYKATR